MKTLKIAMLFTCISAVFLLTAGTRAHAQDTDRAEKPPEWWNAQRDIITALLEQKADFFELVKKVSAEKPKSAQEAMFKLALLMQGGMNKEAIEAIKELKELCPGLHNSQIHNIYYEACNQLAAWDIAKSVIEIFADNVSHIPLDRDLLAHFKKSGWSTDRIDRWLASLGTGKDNFWVKERLKFNREHDRGERMVQELTGRVRKNPQDVKGAIQFLDCLIYADYATDLSWLTKTVKPKLATQAEHIAARIQRISGWRDQPERQQASNRTAAVFFYGKAIETPLTDKETQQLAMMCSAAFVPEERLQAMFAVKVREAMSECLLKLDRKDEAQKWMVEAQDIRKKHNLGRNAFFAGQVQGASGQRVIEGRIKKEEKKSKNNPEYWRERALYYRGRKETQLEEDALKKGLALTAPRDEPEKQSRERMQLRSWLLCDYAHFLKRDKRDKLAIAMLRREINDMPADSWSVKGAVTTLTHSHFCKYIDANDEVLWKWLSNRPRWSYVESGLLRDMLARAKRENLDKHFSRAEKLAKGQDLSRAYSLGSIMNRMKFAKRSIPLLEYAVEHASEKTLRKDALYTLFDSYLDTGDWKNAEKIFPNIYKKLSPRGVSKRYSRIAVVALESGAREDAMRIWKAAVNINPSEMENLSELGRKGLKTELVKFYRELSKRIPSSTIPSKALKILTRK